MGEVPKEKTHERLVEVNEILSGWIATGEYLSGAGCGCGHEADGIEEELEGSSIPRFDEEGG